MNSSYRSNRLGLSHRDLYAMRRGGCLELYYYHMVEWFWWDSSLILTINWFSSLLWHCWFYHLACKNRRQDDQWDDKFLHYYCYYLFGTVIALCLTQLNFITVQMIMLVRPVIIIQLLNNAGVLPDGRYNKNTRIEYCCRKDGAAERPIQLPSSAPFYLYKHGDICQEV